MVYFVSAQYEMGIKPNERLTEISTYVQALSETDAISSFVAYLKRNEYPEQRYSPKKITITKISNLYN